MRIELAPSILSADFARLAEQLACMESGGADAVHVDVMDGRFAPNMTIGPPVVAALKKATRLPLDCHLMIVEPERWIDTFVKSGASRLTVHAEAATHLHRTIESIKAAGAEAGVAINPGTPLSAVEEILTELDVLLVMSVNPGFSAQKFIPSAVDKVRRLALLCEQHGVAPLIQVDGGVSASNAGELVHAGARSLVAGAAVFGAADPAEAVRVLRRAAEAAR